MSSISEELSLKYGRYRAQFGQADLGKLVAPPEIRVDYQTIRTPIRESSNAVLTGEVESAPRLTGEAILNLAACDAAWALLEDDLWMTRELRLSPETPGTGVVLRFPAAQLEPRWEFQPAAAGPHTLRIHLRLRMDSAGKIFHRA